MQKVQRRFGKVLKRSEDSTDVATILHEFELADELLDKFIESVNAFKIAWGHILARQLSVAKEFEVLYKPIESSTDPKIPSEPSPNSTPRAYLEKAAHLRLSYGEVQQELQQENSLIDSKLLKPALDAKQSITPLKKVLKKREDHKLDFERYHGRAETARKNAKSQRDEVALQRHEVNLDQAQQEYQRMDEHVKAHFPLVVDAISSLMPHLLATQIMLQHTLVAQLYTILHEYCEKHRFPSPAPSMDKIVSVWDAEYTPLREQIESELELLAGGKAKQQSMSLPETASSVTGLGLRGKITTRRTSSQNSIPTRSKSPGMSQGLLPEDEEAPPTKPPRSPGPSIPFSSKPRIPSGQMTPSDGEGLQLPDTPFSHGSRRSSASTAYLTPLGSSFSDAPPGTPLGSSYGGASSAAPPQDYFGAARKPSISSIASSIASKKKPPPPPTKRIPSSSPQPIFVTALYDFQGQGGDDLSFREGDQIKIIKKSDSTDDWWLGQLRGVTGSFPANYVQT